MKGTTIMYIVFLLVIAFYYFAWGMKELVAVGFILTFSVMLGISEKVHEKEDWKAPDMSNEFYIYDDDYCVKAVCKDCNWTLKGGPVLTLMEVEELIKHAKKHKRKSK